MNKLLFALLYFLISKTLLIGDYYKMSPYDRVVSQKNHLLESKSFNSKDGIKVDIVSTSKKEAFFEDGSTIIANFTVENENGDIILKNKSLKIKLQNKNSFFQSSILKFPIGSKLLFTIPAKADLSDITPLYKFNQSTYKDKFIYLILNTSAPLNTDAQKNGSVP